RSSLTSEVAGETSGLTALDAKIQADADPATLRSDAASIVTAYRVFALEVPKVREVIAADAELAAVAALHAVDGRLTVAIAQAKGGGTDTTAAEAAQATMQSQTSAAGTAAAAVAPTVLPLTPP